MTSAMASLIHISPLFGSSVRFAFRISRALPFALFLALSLFGTSCQKVLLVTHVDRNWYPACSCETGNRHMPQVIEVQLRNRNGKPKVGRPIFMENAEVVSFKSQPQEKGDSDTGKVKPESLSTLDLVRLSNAQVDGKDRAFKPTDGGGIARFEFACVEPISCDKSAQWHSGLYELRFSYLGKHGKKAKAKKANRALHVQVALCAGDMGCKECFGK
ncbi:MAG: hypothetical protein IPP33_14025 [Flavobacteriales bacterium]|nr:hypothetical protein [Flavobacteriales bacterium]